MADMLLTISRSARARALLGALRLPLPLPQTLERAQSGWSARELEGRRVAVLQLGAGHLIPQLADALGGAGAVAFVPDGLLPSFDREGSAPGAPLAQAARLDGIIIDATGAGFISALDGLQRELGPLLPRLKTCGRVVVVGQSLSGLEPAHAAAQGALDGFTRSLAREIGGRGATANLLRVEPGAEARLGAPLIFLLSARSAFISAQPLTISAQAAGQPARLHARGLVHKVALVTGGAQGIGAATARALAAEGAEVIVLDRPEEAAAAQALAHSVAGRALLVDLADPSAAQQVVDALGARGVDIVVHNAGVTRDKTLARMRPEQWEQVMTINLDAILRLHAALAAGPLHDAGRVICLSSIAGIAGNMGQTAYAASKAGLIALVRAEASALAARGVTMNAVAPGFIETRMTAAIPVAIREAGRRLSALSQGGQPEDVAQAITFLAQPAAQGLTGQTLRVCGGAFMGA